MSWSPKAPFLEMCPVTSSIVFGVEIDLTPHEFLHYYQL